MEAEQIAKSKDWLRSVGRSVIFTSPTCEHAQSLERYIEELEQQCAAMRDYLSTHDHTKHDAAMAAAQEHLHTEE